MKIRELELKDAELMLEWMHDESVVKNMHSNFAAKTLEDCKKFINNSMSKSDVNFAVVSDDDEYMGTISLKHIDVKKSSAEFAITVRKNAMGFGYSWFGMQKIIEYGFEVLKLNYIYWCVSEKNERACKFYDKHHFTKRNFDSALFSDNYSNVEDLRWYIVYKDEDFTHKNKESIFGCKIVNINERTTKDAGQLNFFESQKDVPFEIKRFYYISNVKEGIKRGYHAHKDLKQLLFCPFGKIVLILDDGFSREEILLDCPSKGIIIDRPIWREMLWIQSNSVLCVAASDYYSEDDYIRDYDAFLKLQKGE